MPDTQNTEKMIGLSALAALVAGCLLVLFPFVTALMLAAILAHSTWPLNTRLRRAVGGRNTLAAAIMTLTAILFLLAPFVIVAAGLADNATALIEALRAVFESGVLNPPAWLKALPLVGEALHAYWSNLALDEAHLTEELRRLIPAARQTIVAGGGHLAAGLLQLALSLLVAFFLFRDGDMVAARLRDGASRVAGSDARRLIEVSGKTVNS
ncbi:MAG: AI-2E family transporter, partial [Burkholderiales bacterium]